MGEPRATPACPCSLSFPNYKMWLLVPCPKSRRAPIAPPGIDTGAEQRSHQLQPIPTAALGPQKLYLESQKLRHRQQCWADGTRPRCVLWNSATREERTMSISEGCSAPVWRSSPVPSTASLSSALASLSPAWHSLPLPSTATGPFLSLPVLWGGRCLTGLTPAASHHCHAVTAEVASGWVEACPVCGPPQLM